MPDKPKAKRKISLRKRYHSRELTNHLQELAAEAFEVTEEDECLTRGEALARLLWQKALGHVKKSISDEGKETEIYFPPEAWAITLIYERMEGKAPQAVPDDGGRVKAIDKVRELAKNLVNALAPEDYGDPPSLDNCQEN